MTSLRKINVQPREPLASEVARRLLDYLFSGEIAPGDQLPSERKLTETLGVNRPAVREALRALSFLGLIEVRQSSGSYFRDPDQDLLFTMFELSLMFGQGRLTSLMEARSELETAVAGWAAERRSDDQLDELESHLATMKVAKGDAFVEADVAFHATIAEAADNEVMRDMLKGVRAMVRNWVGTNVRSVGTTAIAYADHVPIYDAIRDQDVDGARAAMAKHMAGASKRLSRAINVEKAQKSRLTKRSNKAVTSSPRKGRGSGTSM